MREEEPKNRSTAVEHVNVRMTLPTYGFICKVIAVFVALDGLAVMTSLIDSYAKIAAIPQESWLSTVSRAPSLLVPLILTTLYFLAALWLWRVPAALIPSSEPIKTENNLDILRAGAKLLGIYFMIVAIPNLFFAFLLVSVIGAPEDNLTTFFIRQRLIVDVIQVVLGYLLAFRTTWVFSKLLADR